VVLFINDAAAQGARRLYVQGGLTARTGEEHLGQFVLGGSDLVTDVTDSGPLVWGGLSASVGIWLGRRVGVEGDVSRTATQTLPWLYSYLDGTSIQETSTRDVPIVGLLRVAAIPGRRADVNAVVGAGVSWHRATSHPTADCGGSSVIQLPCTPLNPASVSSYVDSSFEPALEFGADVPIRLSGRFAVAPTFRVLIVNRRQWLTAFDHRGPGGGSGTVVIFGCSAVWGGR
jgi:hypothetical protein